MSTELLNHLLAGSLTHADRLAGFAPHPAIQSEVTVRAGLPSDRAAMAALLSERPPKSAMGTCFGDLALGLRHSLVAERDGVLLAFVLFFIHRRRACIDEIRVSRHSDWRQTAGVLVASLQTHLKAVNVHEITYE